MKKRIENFVSNKLELANEMYGGDVSYRPTYGWASMGVCWAGSPRDCIYNNNDAVYDPSGGGGFPPYQKPPTAL